MWDSLPFAVGDSMTRDEPEADETTPEEEEWQLYATAGYAAAEDPWDDLVEVQDEEEQEE